MPAESQKISTNQLNLTYYIYEQRSTAMSNANLLPFEFTDDSVAHWLESISSLSPVNAGSQLNKAINQLRKTKSDQKLNILIKITPATLHLSNTLSSTISPVTDPKTKAVSAKITKLSLQLFRNLALAFHSLIGVETLEEEQKLSAAYFALQIIGQHLRISNIFNEMPSKALWNKSGNLYLFAIANNGLQHNINRKIPEFKSQLTIEAVLKRNLLFTITAFHDLSSADSQEIYLFATQNSKLLEFVTNPNKSSQFYWDIKTDIPCQKSQINQPLSQFSMTLNTLALGDLIQSSSFTTNLSEPAFARLYRHLSVYKKLMADSISTVPVMLNMVSGYNAICASLGERDRLNKIHKLSSEIVDEQPQFDMSLTPMDHQIGFLNPTAESLNLNTSPGSLTKGHSVKCLKTTKDNFLIAEAKNVNHFTSDLLLLINNKNAVLMGIIRQQKIVGSSNSCNILIEKIPGQIMMYHLDAEQESSKNVIVINEESNDPEILLITDKYQNGSTITFNNKTARLESLLEYSPFFLHYRVSFD